MALFMQTDLMGEMEFTNHFHGYCLCLNFHSLVSLNKCTNFLSIIIHTIREPY